MPIYNGPAADGAAVRAGDRASSNAQLDTILPAVRQGATGRPRPRTVVATCRIVRPAPQSIWAAAADPGKQCVSCSANIPRVTPGVAIIEVRTAGISLVAGICTQCAARHDRDLIAATFAALRPLMPSLRPIGPGGSA